MAGHSKWANIRHRKGAQDAKRGKIFTKLIKEITVAAKMGGSDISSNSRLRQSIEKAKSDNLPKDTIDRAVKKGAGELDGVVYEEGMFEGYGPGGAAVMVEFMTDNRTRTVADVRYIFSRNNGSLGVNGSVSFLFDRKGVVSFDTEVDFETLFEVALEAGAEDVKEDDDGYEVITEPSSFGEVCDALTAQSLVWQRAEITMIPQTTAVLEGKQAEQMLKMIDKLEDNDDVQNVYSNFDISDEEMEKLDF